MRIRQCAALFMGLAMFAGVFEAAVAAETTKSTIPTVVVSGAKDGQPLELGPTPAVGVVLVAPKAAPDACLLGEVTANPTRLNWDTSASTTQCGIIETD